MNEEYNPYEALDFEKSAFVSAYGDEIKEKYNIDADFMFVEYYSKVKPYIHLLTETKIDGTKIMQSEIALALGVDKALFGVMKKYFPNLEASLNSKRSIMAFKSQMALIKANELKPENAKTVDIMLRRYDPEYMKKDDTPNNEHKVTIDFANGLNPLDNKKDE
jgi:hypothetical protein